MTPRALIGVAIPFYILAAELILSAPRALIRNLLAVVMISSCFFYYRNMWQRPAKEDWRRAAALVEKNVRPDDAYIFEAPGVETAFARYFEKPIPVPLRLGQDPKTDRVWVLRALTTRRVREIKAALEAFGYKLSSRRSVLAVDVLLFEKTVSISPGGGPSPKIS